MKTKNKTVDKIMEKIWKVRGERISSIVYQQYRKIISKAFREYKKEMKDEN